MKMEKTYDELRKSQNIHDPRQVKSPDELQVGKRYQRYFLNSKVEILEILVMNSPEHGWFVGRIKNSDHSVKMGDGKYNYREYSMADMGIIPYKKWGWALGGDYLVPVEEIN